MGWHLALVSGAGSRVRDNWGWSMAVVSAGVQLEGIHLSRKLVGRHTGSGLNTESVPL